MKIYMVSLLHRATIIKGRNHTSMPTVLRLERVYLMRSVIANHNSGE